MPQHPAQTPSDLADRATIVAMSGLEFMRAILDGSLAGAPIAAVLNFRMHAVEPGEVAFRGTPEFSHLNPMGGVHGGWYGTLLDSALGCAVASTLDAGAGYTTLEYKVNLIRAIKPGTLVECRARVQHTGRSTAVAEGTILGVDDGRLYATGSTTCLILRA